VSYSVYLWHWPLIVLVPFVSGNHLGLLDKATIIAVTLVLSGLSKRFIEDRFRTPAWGRPLWKPYLLGAVGMTIVVLGANALHTEVQHRTQQAQAAVRQVLEHHADCVGAAALAAPEGRCAPTTRSPVVPAPIAAAQDKSDAYGTVSGSKDCFATVGHSFPLTTCTRGDPAGRVKVALVGNSHAGEWVPTVEVLAAKYHWRITTYLASQCAFADTAQQFTPASKTDACSNWVHAVTDDIVARHYDLVIMTNRVSVQAVGHGWAGSWAPYRQGYLKVLRALHAARLNVVAIRDTPYPRATNVLVPDCLAAHPDDYTRCAGPRTEWLPRDPTVLAVAALGDPRIRMVDLTDYICEDTTCPAAVGKVVVYFDNSHLSASYAKTLAPYLAPHLRAALRR
jgi:hypothetical protein